MRRKEKSGSSLVFPNAPPTAHQTTAQQQHQQRHSSLLCVSQPHGAHTRVCDFVSRLLIYCIVCISHSLKSNPRTDAFLCNSFCNICTVLTDCYICFIISSFVLCFLKISYFFLNKNF